MRLSSSSPVGPALAGLVLGACHGSSGGAAPLLTNLALAVATLEGHGELWAAGVLESDGGGQDRNGDGDTIDLVVSVLDLADGSLTHLGLARRVLPVLAVGDNLVAFGVPEADQGDVDLNGDGDTFDTVLHVYDARTRATTDTGLAMAFILPAIGAGAVAFSVSEPDQGDTDLDGSGDAVSGVLHVFDARTGLTTNAMRSVTSAITFHDHAFAFTTDEASAGAELNGDGDQDDLDVFQLFDLVVGGIVSVPLAVIGRPLPANVDDWHVLVSELDQGDDLNGDGDELDGVYLAVEPHLGTFQVLGFSAPNTSGALYDGQRVGLLAVEIDGDDRNGDGDFGDSYATLLQPGQAPALVAVLPSAQAQSPLALTPAGLGFLTNEAIVGDLNGNGIDAENILHVLDSATGTLRSTDQEALTLQAAGDHLLFARFEANGSIQEDRNGDGDVDDLVLSWWNTASGASGDTGLATLAGAVASSDALLLLGNEGQQGVDLNGDGDLDDDAWVWHDLATGAQVRLGAASVGTFGAGLLDDGRGVVLVAEEAQGTGGTDLNGDGDAFDLVLHRFQVP